MEPTDRAATDLPDIDIRQSETALPLPSLARNSMYRFMADAAAIALAIVAGTVTARWLGPADKGVYAAIIYLFTLFSIAGSMGLGEAATTLVGQSRYDLHDALRNSLPILAATAGLGVVLFLIAASLQLGMERTTYFDALVAAAIALPLTTTSTVLSIMLNAQEKIGFTSIVSTVTSLTAVLGLIILVIGFDLGVAGAVVATTVGVALGLLVLVRHMLRAGFTLRPRIDTRYAKAAVRYGGAIQGASLMMNAAARVDLLILYAMVGQASAGQYSVALTIGQLVLYAPFAISTATYPRIANVPEEAAVVTRHTFRLGIAAATSVAIAIAAVTPLLVPLLFGRPFRPAVAPSLVLVAAAIPWSAQWLLCRAEAARGNTRPSLRSFATSLIVMVIADVLLIPGFGIMGAAAASALGPFAGLGVAFATRSRAAEDHIGSFIPRPGDFRAVLTSPLRFRRGGHRS